MSAAFVAALSFFTLDFHRRPVLFVGTVLELHLGYSLFGCLLNNHLRIDLATFFNLKLVCDSTGRVSDFICQFLSQFSALID